MLNDNDYGCQCFNQLKGLKHIILGNHDTKTREQLYHNLKNVASIELAKIITYQNLHFFLCHYPTITSNHDYNKPLKQRMLNLCGHTHTTDKFKDWDKGYIYHCELDAHNLYPVSLDQIIKDIRDKVQTYE